MSLGQVQGYVYRAETGIPNHLPTYSAAEVQVFTPICPDLILGAWVWVNEMRLAKAVQEQLDKLSQPERETYVGQFKIFNNGYDVWLEPEES